MSNSLRKRSAECLAIALLFFPPIVAAQGGSVSGASVTGTATIRISPPGGGTASIILSPNNFQTGNEANSIQTAPPGYSGNCSSFPCLDFGKQGTSTSSAALAVSVNNCANAFPAPFAISGCTGSGSATLSSAPFAISGTNAADFAFALGGCTASLSLPSGGTCSGTITFTPTAPAGTVEKAILTVSDDGATPTQTMLLTGVSASVTTVGTSACPTTLSGTTNYQLTANITCPGTAFNVTGTPDVNLNGFTVTWNNTAQTALTAAFLGTASGFAPTIHNGIIAQGTGANTYSGTGGTSPGAAAIGQASGSSWGANAHVFNIAGSFAIQFASFVGQGGSGNAIVLHDNVVNDSAVGTCAAVGCRSSSQSHGLINQDSATGSASGGVQIYDNRLNGSAQGGIRLDAPGAYVGHNLLYPGNASGDNSNNFAFSCWGNNCDAEYNIILFPLDSVNNTSRGIQLSDAESKSTSGKTASNNYVGGYTLANNSEYGGCPLAGAFALQFDDNPHGTNTVSGNTIVGYSGACAAGALRLTDTRLLTNQSSNNTLIGQRIAGASTCVTQTWSEAGAGCANAVSVSGAIGFQSTNDTLIGDSADLFAGADGGCGVIFQSTTFQKGSNPSNFHTFRTQNGPNTPCSPTPAGGGTYDVNLIVIDPIFQAGTSKTDTDIAAQGANTGPASIYIEWTQTVNAVKSSGSAATGATVTFTDALSITYTCTTSLNGATSTCSVPVVDVRNNNDAGANGHESHNPYGLAVSLAGCTTNTQTGLSISAAGTINVTLGGC